MRTREQISAEQDAVQDQYPELKKLTSNSQVSFFRLLKNMWATLAMAIEQRFDDMVKTTNQAIADGQVGSLAWYVQTAKEFQYGDALSVYGDFRVGYATLNPAKQIIAQAAISEGADGRLLLKVAQKQGDIMGPLNNDQRTAFTEYVRLVKYAGVAVDIVSMSADELKLIATVKYDRMVLGSNGTLLANGVDNTSMMGVTAYIRALPFNSVLNLDALSDAVKMSPGVLDFSIQRAFIRASGTTAWQEFTLETVSRAGHMTLNVSETQFSYV